MPHRCMSWAFLALTAACAPSRSTPPAERPAPLLLEPFVPARHRQAISPTRYRLDDEHPATWLEVARSPDATTIAVAYDDHVELRAWPGLAPLWRVPVDPEQPSRVHPTHPLLTFTPDGKRVAWLGGAGLDHRFLVLDAQTGAPHVDLAVPSLPQASSRGGGVTPDSAPQALQVLADGRVFHIHNPFATYVLALDAAQLIVDRSQGGMRPVRAQDSHAAWDSFNGAVTRRGGGGRVEVDCPIYEQDIAIDEGRDRFAYLCARGRDERPELRLRRLASGELLASFPFTSAWGRLVILDADTVLALAHSAPRLTMLYSLVDGVRRRDPATDTWLSP